ncbi:hypothetical protein Xekk_03866 [Xenorhabdus sp. KK7.4]|nr:hypothetical protein Xekk_03866 [Xenorhabdus sp. KK7.4]
MQGQSLAAFGIFKQQFVVTFAFVGFGAEGHLGFAARQSARRDIAGMVGASGDDGLIRIAVQKIHHHFLPDTRDSEHPPALTGPRLGDPDPAGTLVITLAVAIPRELETDTPVLVTEDFFAGRSHDVGNLWAVNHRFR